MCVLKTREKKGRSSRKSPRKLHNKFSNDDCYQWGWKNEKRRETILKERREGAQGRGNTMKKHKKFLAFTRALRIQKKIIIFVDGKQRKGGKRKRWWWWLKYWLFSRYYCGCRKKFITFLQSALERCRILLLQLWINLSY